MGDYERRLDGLRRDKRRIKEDFEDIYDAKDITNTASAFVSLDDYLSHNYALAPSPTPSFVQPAD
jgi:hypothetical protein